jgi:hypothetical protein
MGVPRRAATGTSTPDDPEQASGVSLSLADVVQLPADGAGPVQDDRLSGVVGILEDGPARAADSAERVGDGPLDPFGRGGQRLGEPRNRIFRRLLPECPYRPRVPGGGRDRTVRSPALQISPGARPCPQVRKSSPGAQRTYCWSGQMPAIIVAGNRSTW